MTKSYFSNRRAKLWYSGKEVQKELNIGCPQGSACRPGYWNIGYDDIFDLDNSQDIQVIGFADDTNLMITSNNIETFETKVNNTLLLINKWAVKSKLSFNVNKTQCVLFTKNQKFNNPNIIFNGQTLDLKNSLKYLGLTIDSKLIWREHTLNLEINCRYSNLDNF
jgi:hypothetical protein